MNSDTEQITNQIKKATISVVVAILVVVSHFSAMQAAIISYDPLAPVMSAIVYLIALPFAFAFFLVVFVLARKLGVSYLGTGGSLPQSIPYVDVAQQRQTADERTAEAALDQRLLQQHQKSLKGYRD